MEVRGCSHALGSTQNSPFEEASFPSTGQYLTASMKHFSHCEMKWFLSATLWWLSCLGEFIAVCSGL